MRLNELKSEISFGLENLEKVYQSLSRFSRQGVDTIQP